MALPTRLRIYTKYHHHETLKIYVTHTHFEGSNPLGPLLQTPLREAFEVSVPDGSRHGELAAHAAFGGRHQCGKDEAEGSRGLSDIVRARAHTITGDHS